MLTGVLDNGEEYTECIEGKHVEQSVLAVPERLVSMPLILNRATESWKPWLRGICASSPGAWRLSLTSSTSASHLALPDLIRSRLYTRPSKRMFLPLICTGKLQHSCGRPRWLFEVSKLPSKWERSRFCMLEDKNVPLNVPIKSKLRCREGPGHASVLVFCPGVACWLETLYVPSYAAIVSSCFCDTISYACCVCAVSCPGPS